MLLPGKIRVKYKSKDCHAKAGPPYLVLSGPNIIIIEICGPRII